MGETTQMCKISFGAFPESRTFIWKTLCNDHMGYIFNAMHAAFIHLLE